VERIEGNIGWEREDTSGGNRRWAKAEGRLKEDSGRRMQEGENTRGIIL